MKRDNKKVFIGILLLAIVVIAFSSTFFIYERQRRNDTSAEQAAQGVPRDEYGIKVVTSFYPMYIAAMNITDGVDGVTLRNLSEPQTGCLHDYTLTTGDMKTLSNADIFVINGGGIETFISDVAESYPELKVVNASDGLELLELEEHEHEHEHEDGANAHAWMDIELYMKQVDNIAAALGKADPEHAEDYMKNADAYKERLEPLSERLQDLKGDMSGKNIVIFHEAFEYLADDLGMNVSFLMDLDEERQISAGEKADMLTAVNDDGVKIVLADRTYGEKMGDVVDSETDATTIYIDPLTRGEYEKDSYIVHMNANIDALETARRLLK